MNMNSKSRNSPNHDLGWCNYINWDSHFIQHVLPDPTRLFVIVCCTIMYVRYIQAHDYNYILGIQNFILNPFVMFYVASAQITFYLGTKHGAAHGTSSLPRPTYEKWIIEWYYWNGCLFHAIMDGSSGSLRLVPVVVHQYDILDYRFPTHHTVPYIIGMIELLVMYPLCLVTMYFILVDTKHPYRFPLEILLSTLHITGMVVFVFTEVYDGQCHIPALDPVGRNCHTEDHTTQYKFFNLYHITYYWFGFWFCNMIWGIVPIYRIVRSVQECHRAFVLAPSSVPVPTGTTTTTANGSKQD